MNRLLSSVLGHRGLFLLFVSVSWIVIGYGYISAPLQSHAGKMALQLSINIMPLSAWGFIWVACGLVGLVSAFLRGPGADRFGFIALEAIGMWWSATYLVGWFVGYYSRGWAAAAIYGAICGGIIVVSGWSEPPYGFVPEHKGVQK